MTQQAPQGGHALGWPHVVAPQRVGNVAAAWLLSAPAVQPDAQSCCLPSLLSPDSSCVLQETAAPGCKAAELPDARCVRASSVDPVKDGDLFEHLHKLACQQLPMMCCSQTDA